VDMAVMSIDAVNLVHRYIFTVILILLDSVKLRLRLGQEDIYNGGSNPLFLCES
jgi:hypothetical protein